MTTTTFETARVGDKVFSHTFGWGEIVRISVLAIRPIFVSFFRNDESEFYTLEGYCYPDLQVQSLFWDEAKIDAPTKPVPKKIVNGVEIPDIAFKPREGAACYVPSPIIPELHLRVQYCSSKADEHLFTNGLCYPDTEQGKQAAILHAKAMLGIADRR
jgi:hypothetical protein